MGERQTHDRQVGKQTCVGHVDNAPLINMIYYNIFIYIYIYEYSNTEVEREPIQP